MLLSPFIKPGTVSLDDYNHYSLLASIEDLFSLSRLGFAADVPRTFGTDVYNERRDSAVGAHSYIARLIGPVS